MRHQFSIALVAILVTVALSAPAQADAIAWRTNYDAARAESAASGRPMLLHFGATWCVPCKRVERTVFTNPEAVTAINTQFVPVKIDVDEHPELKEQFTVGSIPADLVVAPDGRVVQRETGEKSAAVYVALLQRAQTYYAQSVAAASRAVPRMPAIGFSHTPAQNVATQNLAPQNLAVVSGVGYQGPPQNYPPPTAQQSAMLGTPYVSPAPASSHPPAGHPASFSAAPPQQQLATQQQFPQQSFPRQPFAQQTMPQQAIMPQPAANPNMANPRAVVATPSGNPPLALDGFCSVRLVERGEWTSGRKEFGLRHRGRTYLFSGPDEWQRFNANPDKYAPLASGLDPVLIVDANQQVDGRRKHGVTYRGQVLLFSSEETLGRFSRDPERYATLVRRTGR